MVRGASPNFVPFQTTPKLPKPDMELPLDKQKIARGSLGKSITEHLCLQLQGSSGTLEGQKPRERQLTASRKWRPSLPILQESSISEAQIASPASIYGR